MIKFLNPDEYIFEQRFNAVRSLIRPFKRTFIGAGDQTWGYLAPVIKAFDATASAVWLFSYSKAADLATLRASLTMCLNFYQA